MRDLLFETAATVDAGAHVSRAVVDADFAERAVAPKECPRFRLARLNQRLVLLLGHEHFLGAKIFAYGCVHGSPHKLVERPANKNLGDGNFITIVRVGTGLF